MREKVILMCSKCLSRNYQTTISGGKKKIEGLNKFCPKCNEKTLHKITK